MTELAQKSASVMDQEKARKGSTVDSMSMIIGPAPTNKTDHLLSAEPAIAAGSHAMVLRVNVPPGDPGSGPHRHSGPVFGYVTEGEIWFELEGQEPYLITAGEAFWEPGGDLVHWQAGNPNTEVASTFVVFMLCAPDVEMMTFLDAEEIAARAHLRHPSAIEQVWPPR